MPGEVTAAARVLPKNGSRWTPNPTPAGATRPLRAVGLGRKEVFFRKSSTWSLCAVSNTVSETQRVNCRATEGPGQAPNHGSPQSQGTDEGVLERACNARGVWRRERNDNSDQGVQIHDNESNTKSRAERWVTNVKNRHVKE